MIPIIVLLMIAPGFYTIGIIGYSFHFLESHHQIFDYTKGDQHPYLNSCLFTIALTRIATRATVQTIIFIFLRFSAVLKGWFTNVVAVIHIAMRVIFSGFWSWSLAFLGRATYVLMLKNYQFDIIMDFSWFLMQFFHQVVQKKFTFQKTTFWTYNVQ